jgi:hypothetical protein
MRKLTIGLAVILILGHLLTEASIVLELTFPYLKTVYIHPFISRSYQFPYPEGINILWWVYYCTQDFLWMTTFFVACIISVQYSFRIFRVCCVFFTYHAVDHFLLWYNYKSGYLAYWLMLLSIVCSIVMIFIPEKKRASIKYME